MEIEFKGANCIVFTVKKSEFVVDPELSSMGLKDQGQNAVAQLLTQSRFAAPHSEQTLIIDGPGEYEVQNCSVKGVAAKAHIDDPAAPPSATMYRLDIGGYGVAVIGHVQPLTEDQLEALGVVDILVVPVGGHGYTLDAKAAVDLVREVSPKVVIPTHYADDAIKYEVPQEPLETFLKELGAAHETVSKLKLKGELPETLTVYEITRSK